ncbi:unnamed protein product [Gemmata massiliana]|uniref:Uncharacterized protein n=1 Tax=Gemmata massiliana TaxID=1210884 RepID=A0A6P2CYQ5_9BACT|nr:hypothetical protein [Gemmata massiliana]VTR94029.1 unnamed protein product [Gemmata massiliana]
MFRSISPRPVAALALAWAAFFTANSSARAAFTININGTVVATDGGAGDTDAAAGAINYTGTVDGYMIQITTQTTLSSSTVGDVTTSQLLVVNESGTAPLSVTLGDSTFNTPAGTLGNSTLFASFTRNLSAAATTSGTASMTSTAESASGGGTATTDPIAFSGSLGADAKTTGFNRTSDVYSLFTNVAVDGLKIGDAVVLTADSAVTGGSVTPTPAPAGAVMLLSGLPVLALWRRAQRVRQECTIAGTERARKQLLARSVPALY